MLICDKKMCTRLTVASDKVYQLLAHGWWFSPGTPASSTTKTGRHDIAKMLFNVVALNTNQIKSNPGNPTTNPLSHPGPRRLHGTKHVLK
jgi:hypothetical protein